MRIVEHGFNECRRKFHRQQSLILTNAGICISGKNIGLIYSLNILKVRL